MVINFNKGAGITEAKVQEMIDVSMMDFTGYTGVINLSAAPAAEVKKAFEEPDKWLTSINYSGETYLEHHRRAIRSGETYDIYFYVVGAEADSLTKRIYDRILWASVNPSTGEVETGTSNYAPDIVYDIDNMNAEQLKVLVSRTHAPTAYAESSRFAAVWSYDGRKYMTCARDSSTSTNGQLIGLSYDNGVMYLDRLVIFSDGTLNHNVYTTNITLTPVE